MGIKREKSKAKKQKRKTKNQKRKIKSGKSKAKNQKRNSKSETAKAKQQKRQQKMKMVNSVIVPVLILAASVFPLAMGTGSADFVMPPPPTAAPQSPLSPLRAQAAVAAADSRL